MHKTFYASGFLYHSPTQQILLQQLDNNQQLSTFRGKNTASETTKDVFKRIIAAELGVHLTRPSIIEIYDYFHDELGEHYYLMYASIARPKLNFTLHPGVTVGWFPLKQLTKLQLTKQTKQDLTVGQRVINLIERERQESLIAKNA